MVPYLFAQTPKTMVACSHELVAMIDVGVDNEIGPHDALYGKTYSEIANAFLATSRVPGIQHIDDLALPGPSDEVLKLIENWKAVSKLPYERKRNGL